jgi:hypothetical protein
MSEQEVAIACAKCEASIPRCEFCEEEDCSNAICYQCMTEALGQAAPPIHVHGG